MLYYYKRVYRLYIYNVGNYFLSINILLSKYVTGKVHTIPLPIR